MPERAVFLDRDGTINEEIGYLSDPSLLALISGAAEALVRLRESGFKLIVVSNQSGVARGLFTEDDLQKVNMKLSNLLEQKGAKVDAYYFCPHHPHHGDMVDCECRKPKTGMAVSASEKFGIDLLRSYFVGDKATDIELGKNAGGKTVLVLTGFGNDEMALLREKGIEPDMVSADLPEAADWIIQDAKKYS
ncbi:MAG: D-glycero-alpha-D-manno-heptose-1,7-bisphosphate 7-phosphatase [Nitrospirota bacterium]